MKEIPENLSSSTVEAGGLVRRCNTDITDPSEVLFFGQPSLAKKSFDPVLKGYTRREDPTNTSQNPARSVMEANDPETPVRAVRITPSRNKQSAASENGSTKNICRPIVSPLHNGSSPKLVFSHTESDDNALTSCDQVEQRPDMPEKPQAGRSQPSTPFANATARCSESLAPATPLRTFSPLSDDKIASTGSRAGDSPTPSGRPRSPHAQLFDQTRESDKNKFKEVSEAEHEVMGQMREAVMLSGFDGVLKPGYVYAFYNSEIDRVKIGFTTLPIRQRMQKIRSECKAFDIELVSDPTAVTIYTYRRLEKLVHADLSPHREFFKCACKSKPADVKSLADLEFQSTRRHKEWFRVTGDVAVRTIHLWLDFLQQNPYGLPEKPYLGASGSLRDEWMQKLRAGKSASRSEKHEDHDTRIRRWRSKLGLPDLQGLDGSPPQRSVSAFGDELSVKEESVEHSVNDSGSSAELKMSTTVDQSTPASPSLKYPQASSSQGSEVFQLNGAEEATDRAGETEEVPPCSDRKKGKHIDTPVQSEHSDSKPTEVLPLIQETLDGLRRFMLKTRPPIPERTIFDDLVKFRWPLACNIVFALHGPYVPPLLSALMWMVFLPFLVAELRCWI